MVALWGVAELHPKGYPMETYKRETEEIVAGFLLEKISFPECATALIDAFAGVFARLNGEQLDSLRVLLMAIDGTLTRETERREALKKSRHRYRRDLRARLGSPLRAA